MKFFQLNIATLIFRFYLLMAVVIGAFFSGYPVLAFLALPIFLSAMMGIKFNFRWNAGKQKVGETSKGQAHHQAAH